MAYYEYSPSPLVIPPNVKIRRRFLSRRSTVTSAPLRHEDYHNYDSGTIFYDIFWSAAFDRLIALGPPAINLKTELSALRITCKGVRLSHTIRYYWHLCVIEIACGSRRDMRTGQVLEFQFRSFQTTAPVPEKPQNFCGICADLALMTMQKDTPVRWIEDWCKWHHRLHEVFRVVIYDNGSSNRDLIANALNALSAEMDITFVDWPFMYGPGTSYKNRFSQLGSQNHYRLRFGPHDRWCVMLDVDEYLAADSGFKLMDQLKKRFDPCVAVAMIDSWIVPPHAGQPAHVERTAGDHRFRNREISFRRLKYLFRPTLVEYNRAHIAFPSGSSLSIMQPFPHLYAWFLRFWYGSVLKRVGRSRIGRRFYSSQFRVQYLDPNDVFFFHFRGLNTNWRPEREIGEETEEYNSHQHVLDNRIRDLAVRAGVAYQTEDQSSLNTNPGRR